MAILRAMDGTFYEVPDDQCAKYKIPADKLKDKLGAQAPGAGPSPGEVSGYSAPGGGPMVNVQIYYPGAQSEPGGATAGAEGGVNPYDWRNHHWRNFVQDWRNWRNRWD